MDTLPAIFLFCFVLPIAIAIINFKLKRRHLEKCALRIPGPQPLPIFGNALLFANLKSTKDLWDIIRFLADKYGKLYKIWLGKKLIVFISDPNYVEEILSGTAAINKDSIYDNFSVVCPGILSLNGKEWQNLRKPLNKLFRTQSTHDNVKEFHKNADILCKKLENHLGKGAINIIGFVKQCTLNIVFRTHLGIDKIDEKLIAQIIHHAERYIEISFQKAVNTLHYFDIIFNLTNKGREHKQIITTLRELSITILKKRIEILNSMEGVNIDENPECYTDIIYTSGKMLGTTIDETAGKMIDFVAAGFETTSTTLGNTILYLAMYPELQAKAYKELESVFRNSERQPTLSDINAMTYLKMVLQETLRCTSPTGIFRILSKDIHLDNYTIPSGATVNLQLFKMHRDERYWEYPDKFYPEHFLPEAVAKRPKCAYMPFSLGPRICPGAHFAEISMMIILSTLLRKFFFTTPITPEKLEFKYSLLMESANGYIVEIHKRNY